MCLPYQIAKLTETAMIIYRDVKEAFTETHHRNATYQIKGTFAEKLVCMSLIQVNSVLIA